VPKSPPDERRNANMAFIFHHLRFSFLFSA
jgi:hypothetical protein